MIIVELRNGMGNQMFQYAAGLALAEKHRTVLKLDVRWFRHRPWLEGHNRYALGCFNIVEQFATEQECRSLKTGRGIRKIGRGIRIGSRFSRLFGRPVKGNPIVAREIGDDIKFNRHPDNTYLKGLWQSELHFEPVADLLRLHFSVRYPPSDIISGLKTEIAASPSVSIHIRRGDYVNDAMARKELGPLTLDYFHAALKSVQRQVGDVKAYVFSDDIESLRDDFRPSAECVFVDVSTKFRAHDDLRLMSLCDHHIISNSTFSWWGAWLNPSPTKIVIAPEPWFAGEKFDGKNIVPASWQKMAR